LRKFLFPLVAAAALALVPAAPSQAKASWLSGLAHGVQNQIYTYGYSPWWYGGYTYPTYTYSYSPWYYGYNYTLPNYFYNYSYTPWYYGFGRSLPYRAFYGGYRPWYWGGHHAWHGGWHRR
jgi:hypothetical protein